MKVLIDEGLSTLQQLGGIGYQSVYLWKHLQKLIKCDITDYRLLRKLPRGIKRAAYFGLANIEPYLQKYDLIHYQNYYIPRLFGKTKGITTIHDLGGFKSPPVYPEWYNTYFRRVIRSAVHRSDRIIVPSHAVKQELMSLFPDVDESRAQVCYNGLRSVFFESQWNEEDLASMNLSPRSYFLCVGNLENRKHLPFLLSQFSAARRRSLIAADTKLVLVGKVGVGFENFRHLISDGDQIIQMGRLSDEQLVVLYKFCKAFVFPSLYEGFGIPIVEAMSQKVPILISNIAPSVELHHRHNNQCFVFELGSDESFTETLSHLDKHFAEITPKLHYGDLSIYSYDSIAREHLAVYRHTLQAG